MLNFELSNITPKLFLPDEDERIRCVHHRCRKFLTLQDLRTHVITSKAEGNASSHKWLAKLMEDTSCPLLHCDFVGEEIEEIIFYTSVCSRNINGIGNIGDNDAYSSEMMLSYAAQTVRRGRKLTVELDVPPNCGYHPSLSSGVSAYVPVVDSSPSNLPSRHYWDTVHRSTSC